MRARVVIVAEAEQQLRDVDRWWVRNRQAAPDLFLNELDRAIDLLSETPEIGPRFHRTRRTGIRRLLLRRSKYWVYYLYDANRAIVYILAIWSTFRGSDPDLPQPRI